MVGLREIALQRIADLPEDELVRSVKMLLTQTETRPISNDPVNVTAHDAFHLWRVRLKISVDKGNELRGGAALVERLGELTPQMKLQQFNFSGLDRSGVLFFEKTSSKYVGAILVPHAFEPEQMSRAS